MADALAYDVEDRPSARDFERRARRVRLQFPEPWLNEWTEQVVPSLMDQRNRINDDLSGSILVEDGMVSGSIPDTGPTGTGSTGYTAAQVRTHTYSKTTVAATGVALGAGFFVFLAVVVVGGGALLWWWMTQPDGGEDPEEPVVEDVQVQEDPTEVLAAEEPEEESELPPTRVEPRPASTTPDPDDEFEDEPEDDYSDILGDEPEPQPTSGEGSSDDSLMGTIILAGDASEVWFYQASSRYPSGRMPTGAYTIKASFGGGTMLDAGKVTVPEGGTVTVTCKSRFKRCITQ